MSRGWDVLYAGAFGVFVALGATIALQVLVEAATVETPGAGARSSWLIVALAVGVCVGIVAARAVLWHRRRAAK